MTISVLVVEDNPDNSKLVTWILEDEGFEVTCAETAEKALELLEDSVYTVVLMDISLPGMNGKEATQAIRANPKIADIPVIALTAHAIKGEQESILASGVNELLTKPLDDDKLIATINRYADAS